MRTLPVRPLSVRVRTTLAAIAVRHGGHLVVAGGPPGGHPRAELPLG